MKNHVVIFGVSAILLATASCSSHYTMADISRSRVTIDSSYDVHPDAEAAAFIAPYRHKVDSMMMPVVGRVARYMASRRPESELSNLLTDVLLYSGANFNEHPDFAVYNMGGIRAALAKGDVTLGDVLNVAPFENKVCFLTLSGAKVLELFGQIAMRKGEGVSHGVQLEISKEGKLLTARLNGSPIDPAKAYRVATLDYLAQGNDQLEAFKSATDMNAPAGDANNVRNLISDFFRANTAKGIVVDSKIEGRIKIAE